CGGTCDGFQGVHRYSGTAVPCVEGEFCLPFRALAQPFWSGPEPTAAKPVGSYQPELEREFLIWRPVMASKVTVGEIRRREVLLLDLIKLNHLMDAEAAAL